MCRTPAVSRAKVPRGTHLTEPRNSSLKMLALAAGSFTLLAILIIALAATGVVTFQLGLLMLVALVGLYFGFGVLIAVYRFMSKLE